MTELQELLDEAQDDKLIAQAKQDAMNLLSRREQCTKELRQKLSKKYTARHIDQVFAWLHQHDLQSDYRFAESMIAHRYKQGKGPAHIKQELSQQAINSDIVNELMHSDELDWFAAALDVGTKKLHQVTSFDERESGNYDFKVVQKIKQFLRYRGFMSDHIDYVIGELS